MKELDIYITEKLKINKDSVKSIIDFPITLIYKSVLYEEKLYIDIQKVLDWQYHPDFSCVQAITDKGVTVRMFNFNIPDYESLCYFICYIAYRDLKKIPSFKDEFDYILKNLKNYIDFSEDKDMENFITSILKPNDLYNIWKKIIK